MASKRALAVREILYTVCRFADPSEDLRLVQISKLFFEATIPFIWSNVSGVENLLKLIPGVTFTSSERNPEQMAIGFPFQVDRKRFKIYAPLVKHLEVFSKGIQEHTVPNWILLLSCARDEVLLPNLARLTLKTSSPQDKQIVMWIQAFLSPSLVEISAVPCDRKGQPILSYTDACILLREINFVCPEIKFLSLFPDKENKENYIDRPYVNRSMFELYSSSLSRQLNPMKSLQELCTTTEILASNVFTRLSGFPHLRNLAIYPAPHPTALTCVTRENPFPVLEELSLNRFSYPFILDVWKLPIFENVTSLTITVLTIPQTEDISERISLFMLLVCGRCRHLTNLSIDFDYNDEYKICANISSESILQPMQDVPLQTLELSSSYIPSGATTWNLIPSIWFQLVVLRLPHAEVNAGELVNFASLPNLQHLVAALSLSTPPRKYNSCLPSDKAMCFAVLESFKRIKITGDTFEIAGWLLHLWPNIKRVDWWQGSKKDVSTASNALAITLNRTIELLRGLAETKTKISRVYGPESLKLFPDNF